MTLEQRASGVQVPHINQDLGWPGDRESAPVRSGSRGHVASPIRALDPVGAEQAADGLGFRLVSNDRQRYDAHP